MVGPTRGPAAGDVAVLHSPFFGSGKLEYYLATWRPALEVRGGRLRARRKPAPLLLKARPGLPALLAAPGGAQDRQALLLQSPPAGTQRGRAGRRAACSYVLLRNSFSGKWGSFAQQRPLALSSVRRLQRPPWPIYALCPAKRRGIVSTPILPTSSLAAA